MTRELLLPAPLPLDFSRWYAGHVMLVVGIFVALAVYDFRVSLGGRPAIRADLDD